MRHYHRDKIIDKLETEDRLVFYCSFSTARAGNSLPKELARIPLANFVVHEDLFSFLNGLRCENKNFISYGHKFSVAQ